MKRIIACVLSLVMLASFFSFAYAAEPRASELISSTGISAAAYAGNVVKFTATVRATDIVDQLGFPTIKIQVYNNGSWSTVKTYSSKYGYDRISYAYVASYTGTEGKKYRAVANYKVINGSSSDTRTRTSSTVTAAN